MLRVPVPLAYVRVRFDWAHQRNGSKKIGFSDFRGFRKMSILGFVRWDLGSGRVCNRLKMAVGFKWTNSQLISSHMGPFSTIFKISIILVLIRVVWCTSRAENPSKSISEQASIDCKPSQTPNPIPKVQNDQNYIYPKLSEIWKIDRPLG